MKLLGKHDGDGPHFAGITLNRNLYETVLRDLLCEGTEHTVQLWEGHGASWKLTRYLSLHSPASIPCSCSFGALSLLGREGDVHHGISSIVSCHLMGMTDIPTAPGHPADMYRSHASASNNAGNTNWQIKQTRHACSDKTLCLPACMQALQHKR